MTINFNANRDDARYIQGIVERAVREAERIGQPVKKPIDLMMDLTACHLNGCALRLSDLLSASTFDFVHDVFGIIRHIDRHTGKLDRCFWPRFAATSITPPPAAPEDN